MKRLYFLIVAMFSLFISAYGQNLKCSKMQKTEWGSHFKKLGAGSTLPYFSMNVEPIGIRNNKIYFTADLKKNESKDSLFCYDIEKQQIVVAKANETGNFYFFSKSGLKQIHCKMSADNVTYTVSTIDLNTLEKKDTHEIIELERLKKADFDWYCSMSPDSSKFSFLIGINEGKSDQRDWWCVTYDNIDDTFSKRTVSLKLSQKYYNIYNFSVLDNGDLLVVTRSHDEEKLQKSENICYDVNIIKEDGNEVVVVRQDPSMEMQSLVTHCLYNGNVVFAMTQRDKKDKTDVELHYKFIDIKNTENSSDLKKYRYKDIWLEKQNVSVAKYDEFCVDDVAETDDGKLYFLGFPRTIILRENNRITSWGGFCCLVMDKEGTVEDVHYIERMSKKTFSTGNHSLDGMNMWYNWMKYGNKVYLTFNESLKKIEKNDQKASYTQADKENYIFAYEIGANEVNRFNLTGDKRSELALNKYLGKIDNLFFFTARNQEYGTIASVEFEKAKEVDHTRKTNKKTAVSQNGKKENAKSTAAKSQSGKGGTARKRTVKR